MNVSNKLSRLLPSTYNFGGVTDFNLARWVGQRWFWAFCMLVKPDFMLTRIHRHLCGKLQKLYEDVKNGRDRRMEIDIQPQIGKSTMTSVLFAAWVLGKEPWPVIVASYGASLAERKSQECRDILSEPMYKIIFPTVRLHPDSTSKEFWRTTKGGSYRAVGVGGGLTGMSGKILIADDLLAGEAEAQSDTITDGTWAWWNTVFYTRKQSKSGFILINTRWSLKDVSSRLQEKEESDQAAGLAEGQYDHWERLVFPAIATEDEYIDGQLFRREGEVLCPERFTLEDMIKTRNQLSVSHWAALYQQNPILNEDAEFKQGWFKYFEESEILDIKNQFDIYILVDLAISAKKTADNTVVQVVGKLREQPNIYHLEEYAGHYDPLQTIEILFNLKNKYQDQIVALGIESVGYQKSLSYHITEYSKRTGDYFNIVDLKNTAKKEERIRGLIPLYKAGVLFHRKGVDNELELELLQFPKGKHDDRIDALSSMLQVLKNTVSRRFAKQFRPHMKRYSSELSTNVSHLTNK